MSPFDRLIAAALPLLPRSLVHRVAKRYIAGETLLDAVQTGLKLNRTGLRTTMDILGEDVHRLDQAEAACMGYISLLEAIDRHQLNSTVSIKLTQLGLKVDKRVCMELARKVMLRAAGFGNFVRIDMEDSSCTPDTLEIYSVLRREHLPVGVAIQAYLRRTRDDITRLAGTSNNFRLCKGVYVEPESVAFQKMPEINRNYAELLETLLRARTYVGIATHDDALVEIAERLIRDLGLPKTVYEFQMLLGVREPLRDRLLAAGHPVRIYVPFGKDWYAYSLRRLRENPRLAGYVAKAIIFRN